MFLKNLKDSLDALQILTILRCNKSLYNSFPLLSPYLLIFYLYICNMEELDKYAPFGTKFCEGLCERNVIMTKEGPVIVCEGCDRIVMDNRRKND